MRTGDAAEEKISHRLLEERGQMRKVHVAKVLVLRWIRKRAHRGSEAECLGRSQDERLISEVRLTYGTK